MAHYLYKPHVQGPEFITTPDILVYRAYKARKQGDELVLAPAGVNSISTNPEVQCVKKAVDIIPGYYFVAAGGGCLVSLGAECVIDDTRILLIARSAWRYKYIYDHIEKISLSISTANSGDKRQSLDKFPSHKEIVDHLASGFDDLPRGSMVSIPIPELEQRFDIDETVIVKLDDLKQDRQLSHRLSFMHLSAEHGQGHKKSRYAIGPTTEEVQHYI